MIAEGKVSALRIAGQRIIRISREEVERMKDAFPDIEIKRIKV